MIYRGVAVSNPEVTSQAEREIPPGSIEARSQRIVALLHERSQCMGQWLEAISNGEKVPPQAERRFTALTREIESIYGS